MAVADASTGMDLGTLWIRYKSDKDGLRRELVEGESEVKQSGERTRRSMVQTALLWAQELARGWTEAGRQAADGFTRGADGRLRDARGRFMAAGEGLGRAAGEGAGNGSRLFSTWLGNLSTGATNLATNLWNLVPAILATLAAMAATIPIAYVLGGALGAIPAIVTGGLAAVAALGIGFIGLGDAFKKTSAAGATVADRARSVALAERRLADANREVLASQLALNRARRDAADRLRDLSRNVTGAQIDERDAIAAVAQARRDLERAREGDNPAQIDAATRAYERAEHQLLEVQDRLSDLKREQQESAAAGVEGSDQVVDALERHRRAVESVSDAHYELRQAQQPVGGGASGEVTRIAAAAAAAVATIKSLSDDFTRLRLRIQQRLFDGADREIRSLWDTWEPVLDVRLGSMGSMFNRLFRTWADTSRKPEFVANIASGWASIERLIDRVFTSVAGPGLEAFGKLSRAAGPFLDVLGDELGDIVDEFARWIDEAEQSGDLDKFFKSASEFLSDVIASGKSALSIVGSIISILFKTEDRNPEETAMDGFRRAMEDLAAWFDDPKNQEKIAEWLGQIEDFIIWVRDEAVPTVKGWIDTIDRWADKVGGWIDKGRQLKEGLSNLFDPIKTSFKTAMNFVIEKWNGLRFSLPTVSFLGQTIGGQTIGVKPIPMLKDGGLVKATPGGRMVGVAEAGEDEIVSPVDQMRRIVAEELARAQGERVTHIEIPVYVGDEVVRVVRYEIREHDREVSRADRAGAGKR